MSVHLEAQTSGITFNKIRIKDGTQIILLKPVKSYGRCKADWKRSLHNEYWKGAEDRMTDRMVWD